MTEPVSVAGQDEPVVFSFFADVSSHPSVLELATAVQEIIRNGIGALVKRANWWKKYRALWKMQRVSWDYHIGVVTSFFMHTQYCFYIMHGKVMYDIVLILVVNCYWTEHIEKLCGISGKDRSLPHQLTFDTQDILLEKFAQKQPSCVAYDEKMQVYKTVDSEVSLLPSNNEVEFALLRVEPLARALQENARCWVTSLGKLLNDTTKESLLQLKSELSVSMH